MLRKFATTAVLASAALLFGTPAHATAYFIGGKWYYFSLDFQALIAKITGKDLNDGTSVQTQVVILTADSICLNPQSHNVNPGKGPKGVAYGQSPNLTDGDVLDKNDRQKRNIFTTTAVTADLVAEGDRLRQDLGLCKDAPGASSWVQLYWQDRECNKGALPLADPVCYKDYAYFPDGVTLTYLSGSNAGTAVPTPTDWTFVYLPTTFAFKGNLYNSTSQTPYATIYGQCQFSTNNDPAANQPGQPYSISNPPVDGWAASPPASYDCVSITAAQYNQYLQ